MTVKKAKKPEYPECVCFDCGELYGRRLAGICTVNMGTCGVCGENKAVTEPRDYGHLKDGWENHKRSNK